MTVGTLTPTVKFGSVEATLVNAGGHWWTSSDGRLCYLVINVMRMTSKNGGVGVMNVYPGFGTTGGPPMPMRLGSGLWSQLLNIACPDSMWPSTGGGYAAPVAKINDGEDHIHCATSPACVGGGGNGIKDTDVGATWGWDDHGLLISGSYIVAP